MPSVAHGAHLRPGDLEHVGVQGPTGDNHLATGLAVPHSNMFVIVFGECLGLGSPRSDLETEI